jgi:hypothetical protein
MTSKTFVDGTWEGSVDFLHKLCNQAMVRVRTHRLNIEYDDLFQEASVAFMHSKRAFDPSKGVKFLTYLGYAASNRLSRFVGDAIHDQMEMGSKCVSMDDMQEDEGAGLHEVLPDSNPGAEEILTVQQNIEERLSALSPLARRVIEMSISPPSELLAEFNAFRARCHREREVLNYNSVAPKELTTTFIVTHFLPSVLNIGLSQRRAINAELKRFAEHESI